MTSPIQFIDPRHGTPQDWCDRMVLALDSFDTIPILGPEVGWKDWARQVLQIPRISKLNPPNPDQYRDDEFSEWAIQFNYAVFAGD